MAFRRQSDGLSLIYARQPSIRHRVITKNRSAINPYGEGRAEYNEDVMFRHRSAVQYWTSAILRLLTIIVVMAVSACGGGGETTSITASATPSSYALVVNVAGSGTVTSSPGGISCGSDCSDTYASGTSVTLTATAASGYVFSGWSASGVTCPTTAACTIPMTAARNVTATFTANTYALAVSVTGSGTVTSSPSGINCGSDCSENYASGASVTLTAAPASGYAFSGWSGSGIACSGTGSCTVSMTAARSVVATFSPVAASSYVLQVNLSGSGSVTSSPAGISCGSDCSETYTSGTSVTLTATPASGYIFSSWSGGGCSGAGSCAVSMTATRTVNATFVPSTYALTVNITGSGTVTSAPSGISCGSDCSENYTNGASVVLTAAAASGYSFSGWSGSGISCAGTGTCTVTMSAARSVTATFSALPTYALTTSVTGSGSIVSSPSGISCGSDCTENYTSGTSVALTATAASGYSFSAWGGAGSGSGSCTVSMTAARSVTATFTLNSGGTPTATYELTWDAVTDPLVTGYTLYYSTSPIGSGSVTTVNVGNVTSYTFNPAAAGMTIGNTAYFGVAATSSGATSPMSDVASIIIE